MQPVLRVKVSPFSHFACLSHTYHLISLVGISKFILQAMEMKMEHPKLLGKSLIFFPHLYHTYHFPFRFVKVHAWVYQLLGLLQLLLQRRRLLMLRVASHCCSTRTRTTAVPPRAAYCTVLAYGIKSAVTRTVKSNSNLSTVRYGGSYGWKWL